MPLDTVSVGSNQRLIWVPGDSVNSNQLGNVLAPGDALNFSTYFELLTKSVVGLKNASGLFDEWKSAPGTVGIASVNTEGTKDTYSVATSGFTPAATATDFFSIVGSGTKTVRVLRITISGNATAAISEDILLIKRSTASTGGTPAALTVGLHDSNGNAVTATVNTWTANPGVLGTTAGTFRAKRMNLGATGAAGEVIWDFTTRNSRGIVLRGVAQSLNLNYNGAAVPGGMTLNMDVEFTEE